MNIDLLNSWSSSEEEESYVFEVPKKMNLCKWIELKKKQESKPKKNENSDTFQWSEKDLKEFAIRSKRWMERKKRQLEMMRKFEENKK